MTIDASTVVTGAAVTGAAAAMTAVTMTTVSTALACPTCRDTDNHERVHVTMWGGVVGPALLHHTRCGSCRTTFNGKTGKSNAATIRYVFVLPAALAGALLLALIVVSSF